MFKSKFSTFFKTILCSSWSFINKIQIISLFKNSDLRPYRKQRQMWQQAFIEVWGSVNIFEWHQLYKHWWAKRHIINISKTSQPWLSSFNFLACTPKAYFIINKSSRCFHHVVFLFLYRFLIFRLTNNICKQNNIQCLKSKVLAFYLQ